MQPLARSTRLASLLMSIHAVATLALAASAVGLWRTYCESFGCIGVGIAWFAWVAAYAATLVVGLLALRGARAAAPRLLRLLLAAQLAGGLGLLAYWAMHAFA